MRRRRATGAIIAMMMQFCRLCIIILLASPSLAKQQRRLDDSIQDADPSRREGKIRNGSPSSDHCIEMKRPQPHLPSVPNLLVKGATYAVSFPGSGDRLITKHLVEHISGMLAGDASTSPSLERMKAQHMDHTGFARGQGEVAVVRTNFPHLTGQLSAWDFDVSRAFVVLRSPLTAIPRYFDRLYELNSHVPAGDPSDETTAAFVKWRDNQLGDQLLLWRRSVSFWMEKFADDDGERRVFFSYESLIDEESGMQETVRLAQFLEGGIRASAMELSPGNHSAVAEAVKSFANTDEIYCIWSEMVSVIRHGEGRLSPNQRPFTTDNLVAISRMLLELIDRWSSHHQQLVAILKGYAEEVWNEYQKQLAQPDIAEESSR